MENRKIYLINLYKKHQIAIWSIFVVTMMTLVYLYISTVNVPVMDYWTYICDMTEKVYNGTFSFKDIWTSMGGHRGGLSYLVIAINIGLFKMNTLIGVYGGLVILLLTSIIFYIYYFRKIECLEENIRIKKILFMIIILAIYNLNQWEILTLDFSFNSTLRKISFILTFIFVEKVILGDKTNIKNLLGLLVYILFVTCFMSAGYLPGLIGAVCFGLVVAYAINFSKYNKKIPSSYIAILLVCITGLIIYTHGLVGIGGEGRSLSIFIDDFFNGNLFKGILIMLGSSIAHTSILNIADNMAFLMVIGLILFIVYIIAIILYFKEKMWSEFYVPLMLMAYTAINILIVYYARGNAFNLSYLSSSRYTCETTLGLVGLSMIYVQFICKVNIDQKKIIKKIFYMFPLIFISIFLVYSFKVEFQIGPHRKNYQLDLVKKMQNIERYTDEELLVFQANDPDQVRQGVEIMKKYQLGIFKDIPYEERNKEEIEIIKRGFYEDGWIEGVATIEFITQLEKKLSIVGYYPYEIKEPLNVKIKVNNKEQDVTIKDNSFKINIDIPQNERIKVVIESDFEREASEVDRRRVAFIVSSINIK